MLEPAHKRQLTSTVYATPLMTPSMDLSLSIRLFMFEFRKTGDQDMFLSPPERAKAETGGADQLMLKRRDFPGFAIVNEKKRPHAWDTHYQFSLKTLLSKPTSALIVLVASPLLYHVRTFYTARYTSSTTYPSKSTCTLNQL